MTGLSVLPLGIFTSAEGKKNKHTVKRRGYTEIQKNIAIAIANRIWLTYFNEYGEAKREKERGLGTVIK